MTQDLTASLRASRGFQPRSARTRAHSASRRLNIAELCERERSVAARAGEAVAVPIWPVAAILP
jgi:hypothetical protein